MQLVRLAVLALDQQSIDQLPIPFREFRICVDEIEVGFADLTATVHGQPTLTAFAKMPLKLRPKIAADQSVVISDDDIRALEKEIQKIANIFTLASGKVCRLSSPEPCVALEFENRHDQAFLESALALKTPGTQFELGLASFEIEIWSHINHLVDRDDGIALLVDSLGQSRAGKFRDSWRVFERAFKVAGHKLIGPLSKFLASNDMGYSEHEVKSWATLRDKLVHADQSKDIVLERDLNHAVPRAQQAAYDVLFNKSEWRSNTISRRDIWYPGCGVAARPNAAFVYQGKALTMPISLLDDYRAFPLELGFNIFEYQNNWWPKPSPRRSFELSEGLFFEVKAPRNGQSSAQFNPISPA
jgi:hypothetical protein